MTTDVFGNYINPFQEFQQQMDKITAPFRDSQQQIKEIIRPLNDFKQRMLIDFPTANLRTTLSTIFDFQQQINSLNSVMFPVQIRSQLDYISEITRSLDLKTIETFGSLNFNNQAFTSELNSLQNEYKNLSIEKKLTALGRLSSIVISEQAHECDLKLSAEQTQEFCDEIETARLYHSSFLELIEDGLHNFKLKYPQIYEVVVNFLIGVIASLVATGVLALINMKPAPSSPTSTTIYVYQIQNVIDQAPYYYYVDYLDSGEERLQQGWVSKRAYNYYFNNK